MAAAVVGPSKEELARERRHARLPPKIAAKPKAKRARPAPPSSGESSSGSSAGEEEEEEAADAEPEPGGSSPKRARREATPPAAAAPPAGARAGMLSCRACTMEFAAAQLESNFYCPCCHLIYTQESDAAPNRVRMAQLLSPSAPSGGASSSVSSSQFEQNTAKPKLGAYETELKRLLEVAGSPLERFADVRPISHADAIAGMATSAYRGSSYQRQSKLLTDLIRSGHFKELTLALPIGNAEALQRRMAESKGGKVLLKDGELVSTSATMVERPLAGLQEFLKIVIVAILPSLFDRPRAMLDWLELSRSMINIAESPQDGWPVAASYLTNLLADRMATGAPFNAIDVHLLQTERASNHAPHRGAPAGGAGDDRAGRPEWFGQCAKDVCREWNLGTCRLPAGQCRFKHICLWNGCGEDHKGRDCPRCPAGARNYQPRAGAGNGRGRGGGGGGKGRPAAGPPRK
jgi:hypothetical protein